MDFSTFHYALGTTNAAKKSAVQLATGVEPICLSVPSCISDQPMTEEETITGAINRAKTVFTQIPNVDIGLGLEGGLMYDERFTQEWYLISICAAWNGMKLHVGKGLSFPIPKQAAERIQKENIELSTIIDEWSGIRNSNHQGGAYALLTEGRIRRADVFRDAVIAALTPYFSKLYV
ncbi:hypothetical protein AN963_10420 [Brevibacillus choshinensis]|uniref:inosine/xanthosine triphosphatase n=1 Tax=Brevibacillus choshinensis TaxID=54911 RepID=A0ABR5N4B2_BRECH|nr:inosine/xanthosine triphosphatase [Brevibacillus choshinensis]KQL45484.1 hypothetical protein AN963_10420 [Brevibacillus choshinensis]